MNTDKRDFILTMMVVVGVLIAAITILSLIERHEAHQHELQVRCIDNGGTWGDDGCEQ